MPCSRDPLEPGSDAVVADAEPGFRRCCRELHGGVDFRHLGPWDADASAAADPAGEPTDASGALAPVAGTDEESDDLGAVARAAFDREVVDVAAAAPLAVEELVVEDVAADDDPPGCQFCPALVRIMRGIAVTATIAMTTR